MSESPSADVPGPDRLRLRGAITKRLTVWKDVGCLTKTSWTGFISQRAQWHELGLSGGSTKNLTIWMDVRSHQNFLVRSHRQLNGKTWTQKWKHEEPDYLNGWSSLTKTSMVRFYLAESPIALTETQRCKHIELDFLKECRLSRQNFLDRFYLAKSSMARTWIQR